jgi:hypothetical protein
VSLKKGIDKTVQGLIQELENRARPVKGGGDIKGDYCILMLECVSFIYFHFLAPINNKMCMRNIVHASFGAFRFYSCCSYLCWQ